MIIRRGEIYLVKLDPTLGREIRKTRPALIIQNDVGNDVSPLTIVAPISSIKTGSKRYPIDVWVTPKESGLLRPSKVCLNQIRTVDKQRLIKKVGRLDSKRMTEVDQAIRVSLDLP